MRRWICIIALLFLAIQADAAPHPAISRKDSHVWEYIIYANPDRISPKEPTPTFIVGFGQKDQGFRVDIIATEQQLTTNRTVMRLHCAPSTVSRTNTMGPVGANGTYSVQYFFPWSSNGLDEAWIEVDFCGETYWLDVPYGFTRNPAQPLPQSGNTTGTPKSFALPKKLSSHDHVVPWKDVHYDFGVIQHGWRLYLLQSNDAVPVSEAVLYRDDSRVGESMYLWKKETPKTRLVIRDQAGDIIFGTLTAIKLHEDGMRRSDFYTLTGNINSSARTWGRIEISVENKTFSLVVPSSLYKWGHGHADNHRNSK